MEEGKLKYLGYLILSNIDCINCNSEGNFYVCGIPSITAFMGLIHKLERDINKKLSNQTEYFSIIFESAAIIVHEVQEKNSLQKCPHTLEKHLIKKEGEIKTPPIIEEIKCDINFSLIIELKKFKDSNTTLKDLDSYNFGNFFKSSPLLGGNLQNTPPRVKMIEPKWEELQSILKNIKKGYFIKNRSDIFAEHGTFFGEDVEINDNLDKFIFSLSRKKTDKSHKNSYKSNDIPGWIIPLAIGYKVLETPTKKEGIRDNRYKHAYVEPVCSLGEFYSTYKLQKIENKEQLEMENIFWKSKEIYNDNSNDLNKLKYFIYTTNK